MIARNFIQFPEALAAQLCLDFGALVKWATKRPGARILRTIRAQRAAATRRMPFVRPDFPPLCVADSAPTPQWLKAAVKRARALARNVRAAILPLIA